MNRYQFTSESVTEGHPDKICDQISDAILDGILAQDKTARVACETLAKTGMVVVAGEITTSAWVDIPAVVRETVRQIGYTHSEMGFDADTCAVLPAIEKQSPDISQGVSEGEGQFKEMGAGDQGLMFGFACDESPELMPAPIQYAHGLTRQLAAVRKSGKADFLRPDGKSQVTLEYEEGAPVRVETIVISTQHAEGVKNKQIHEAVRELVIDKVVPKRLIDKQTKIYINPTGRFVLGGPFADCGLTGRKIIVDTYGGMGRHGGGAFSGKDPTKVDRSAAYYARYIAKNVVAGKLAQRCEVQLAYAIGVAQPVGVFVNTFGTGRVNDEELARYIHESFDMRPKAIIEQLDLLRPIYKATAAYGHFGRAEFPWEKTDRAAKMADDLLRGVSRVTNGHSNGSNGAEKKKDKSKKKNKHREAVVLAVALLVVRYGLGVNEKRGWAARAIRYRLPSGSGHASSCFREGVAPRSLAERARACSRLFIKAARRGCLRLRFRGVAARRSRRAASRAACQAMFLRLPPRSALAL